MEDVEAQAEFGSRGLHAKRAGGHSLVGKSSWKIINKNNDGNNIHYVV